MSTPTKGGIALVGVDTYQRRYHFGRCQHLVISRCLHPVLTPCIAKLLTMGVKTLQTRFCFGALIQYSCLIQWRYMQTVQSLIWSKGKLVKQVVWNCFVIQIKFVCNNTACWKITGILYCSVLRFASLLGGPQMYTSFKSSWQNHRSWQDVF